MNKDDNTVLKWVIIENIIYVAMFFALLLLMDGWAKAWAIVPILFINFIKRDNEESQQEEDDYIMGIVSSKKSVEVRVKEIKEESVVLEIISEMSDGPYVDNRSSIQVELKEGQSKSAL